MTQEKLQKGFELSREIDALMAHRERLVIAIEKDAKPYDITFVYPENKGDENGIPFRVLPKYLPNISLSEILLLLDEDIASLTKEFDEL